MATFAFSNTGAISYWLGATSLWRVFTGTPTLYSSVSTSDMNAIDAVGDRAEVLILELLPLRRLGAEQRAAGVDQIGTRQIEVADRSGNIPARDRRW